MIEHIQFLLKNYFRISKFFDEIISMVYLIISSSLNSIDCIKYIYFLNIKNNVIFLYFEVSSDKNLNFSKHANFLIKTDEYTIYF